MKTNPEILANEASSINARARGFDLRASVLLAATAALGLIAGFFYAYEVSVMRGFAILSDRDFIAAMQSVNATIRNAAFAPSFFGAALLSALVVLMHWRDILRTKGLLIAAAALLYIGGGLLLTMTINVPLNEWLAAQGPASGIAEPSAIRAAYESKWVFWNLVRAIASFLAFLLMAIAFRIDSRSP